MSNVAYVTTKDVRHLAAWTADVPSRMSGFPSGVYRSICGQERGKRSDIVWVGFPYEDQKVVDRALAKSVCSRCLKALDQLVAISTLGAQR